MKAFRCTDHVNRGQRFMGLGRSLSENYVHFLLFAPGLMTFPPPKPMAGFGRFAREDFAEVRFITCGTDFRHHKHTKKIQYSLMDTTSFAFTAYLNDFTVIQWSLDTAVEAFFLPLLFTSHHNGSGRSTGSVSASSEEKD